MTDRYVHHIDPIIVTVFGVHLWWYGAFYVAGLLTAHLFLRLRRAELGLSLRSVYALSVLLAACVLAGGRLVEVAFYEWPYYRDHLAQIAALWLGGMSTHGLLVGGLVAIALFARLERRSFLDITDAIAIPAALIMAFGRLANFVDGQIVGGITDLPWAVKFPDAQGYRHPVVLYDGLKNLLIVPVLMVANRFDPPRGTRTGIFLFLYAGLRLFVDLFREYPTTLFGLAIATIGIDLQSGVPRYTFGNPELMDGLEFLVVAIGLYDLLGGAILASTNPRWIGHAMEPLVFVGFVFWVLCFTLSRYSRRLERRHSRQPETAAGSRPAEGA